MCVWKENSRFVEQKIQRFFLQKSFSKNAFRTRVSNVPHLTACRILLVVSPYDSTDYRTITEWGEKREKRACQNHPFRLIT